jgi:urea carboxylase-associated protein 2
VATDTTPAPDATLTPGTTPTPDTTPAGEVLYDETIAPGGYWTATLGRWQRLRIVDADGRQSCSMLAYNANETSERFNAPDTVKIQNQIFLTTGRLLFSDLGRVLLSIVDDTSGHHDALAGFGDAAHDDRRYGSGSYLDRHNDFHRNARDNFVMALGRHGLSRRDLVMSFNPFARVRVAAEGTLVWEDGVGRAGAALELRAELRVLVAISATPHVLDPRPAYAPGPLRVQILQARPPAADDGCRTFSDEARRGFENTDNYWAQVSA